jgi:hypothetical protein
MVHRSLSLLVFLICAVWLSGGTRLCGQNELASDSVSIVAPLGEAVLLARNQLVNGGAQPASYRWRKTIVSTTQGWSFAVCDSNACHPPAVDSMWLDLPAGGSSRLDVQAFPDRIAGTAEVTVEVHNLTTGQTAAAHYLFSNQTSSTTAPLLLQVAIFPNPTADLLYLDTKGRSFGARLYDANGRVVHAFTASGGTTEIDLRPLPRGWYTLRLFTPEGFQLGRRILKQ